METAERFIGFCALFSSHTWLFLPCVWVSLHLRGSIYPSHSLSLSPSVSFVCFNLFCLFLSLPLSLSLSLSRSLSFSLFLSPSLSLSLFSLLVGLFLSPSLPLCLSPPVFLLCLSPCPLESPSCLSSPTTSDLETEKTSTYQLRIPVALISEELGGWLSMARESSP